MQKKPDKAILMLKLFSLSNSLLLLFVGDEFTN